MPNTPQMSRLRKSAPEFPEESSLTSFKNLQQKASWNYTKLAEEIERQRRIQEDKEIEEEEKRESILNRAYTIILEEGERERRILELLELKNLKEKEGKEQKEEISEKKEISEETTKEPVLLITDEESESTKERESSELDRAYTIVLEEQERARRIAEEGYLNDVQEEQRKDDHAWTIIAEEQERARRIAEDKYLDEVEEEHRATNQAYATIAEEQEKIRRIAEDQYADEVELGYRADDKAWARIATEEERSRLIALGTPDQSILKRIRFIAEHAAFAATQRTEKPQQKPLRRSGQRSLRKSGNGQPQQKEVWVKKTSPPVEAKEPTKEMVKEEPKQVPKEKMEKAEAVPKEQRATKLREPRAETLPVPITIPTMPTTFPTTIETSGIPEPPPPPEWAIKKEQKTKPVVLKKKTTPTKLRTPMPTPTSSEKTETTKQLEGLLQHRQVFDERKAMVDRMSTELFEKIARKVKGAER